MSLAEVRLMRAFRASSILFLRTSHHGLKGSFSKYLFLRLVVETYLSGAKLTPIMMGKGQIHCNANGIRYAHWSSLSTVPRRTPVEMKPPIDQHRFTYEVKYALKATGLTSAAYVVVSV